MTMISRLAVVALSLSLSVFAQVKAPERQVNVEAPAVTSERDPKVTVELTEDARHIGSERYASDELDREIHVFVEGSRHTMKVERIYVVVFEQYLPEKPDARFENESARHIELGGMDFLLDTSARSADAVAKEGSEQENMQKLITAKGWKLPAEGMIFTRLVHVPDTEKRKRMVVIYGEFLEPWNVTAADVKEGGKSHALWTKLEKGMIERVKDKVFVTAGGQ
jgi:hypothetical protein